MVSATLQPRAPSRNSLLRYMSVPLRGLWQSRTFLASLRACRSLMSSATRTAAPSGISAAISESASASIAVFVVRVFLVLASCVAKRVRSSNIISVGQYRRETLTTACLEVSPRRSAMAAAYAMRYTSTERVSLHSTRSPPHAPSPWADNASAYCSLSGSGTSWSS